MARSLSLIVALRAPQGRWRAPANSQGGSRSTLQLSVSSSCHAFRPGLARSPGHRPMRQVSSRRSSPPLRSLREPRWSVRISYSHWAFRADHRRIRAARQILSPGPQLCEPLGAIQSDHRQHDGSARRVCDDREANETRAVLSHLTQPTRSARTITLACGTVLVAEAYWRASGISRPTRAGRGGLRRLERTKGL